MSLLTKNRQPSKSKKKKCSELDTPKVTCPGVLDTSTADLGIRHILPWTAAPAHQEQAKKIQMPHNTTSLGISLQTQPPWQPNTDKEQESHCGMEAED